MGNEAIAPERLMNYALAVGMIEKLSSECILSDKAKRRLPDFIGRRYGFDKKSIFLK